MFLSGRFQAVHGETKLFLFSSSSVLEIDLGPSSLVIAACCIKADGLKATVVYTASTLL